MVVRGDGSAEGVRVEEVRGVRKTIASVATAKGLKTSLKVTIALSVAHWQLLSQGGQPLL